MDERKPLTAMMDNVLAWRLGVVAKEAANVSAGDPIDTGLTLRRMLEDQGFELRLSPKVGQRPIYAIPSPSGDDETSST